MAGLSNKVNLKLEDAINPLIQGLAKSIACLPTGRQGFF